MVNAKVIDYLSIVNNAGKKNKLLPKKQQQELDYLLDGGTPAPENKLLSQKIKLLFINGDIVILQLIEQFGHSWW